MATSGSYNVALGMNALGAATVTGSSNTALGAGTLYYTTYGGFNVAIGQDAMLYNDTGNANIAVGFESLWGAHTSANNVAIGWKAARQIVGNDNVVIGNDAGHNNTDATVGKNVIIGALAGNSIATGGDNNIMVGWGAGGTTTTGANNILIGYDIQAATATTSNYLNIGNAITGDLSISYVNMNGGLALKTDISPAQITTNQKRLQSNGTCNRFSSAPDREHLGQHHRACGRRGRARAHPVKHRTRYNYSFEPERVLGRRKSLCVQQKHIPCCRSEHWHYL